MTTFNLNGNNWANSNNIGKKLLLKEGWSEGEGLGKYKQGTNVHIKVSVKNEKDGIGLKSEKRQNDLSLMQCFVFDNLLKSKYGKPTENAKDTEESIERGLSRSRYGRAVSKDYFKPVKNDEWNKILCKVKVDETSNEISSVNEIEINKSCANNNFTSSYTIYEYFTMKMKNQRNYDQEEFEVLDKTTVNHFIANKMDCLKSHLKDRQVVNSELKKTKMRRCDLDGEVLKKENDTLELKLETLNKMPEDESLVKKKSKKSKSETTTNEPENDSSKMKRKRKLKVDVSEEIEEISLKKKSRKSKVQESFLLDKEEETGPKKSTETKIDSRETVDIKKSKGKKTELRDKTEGQTETPFLKGQDKIVIVKEIVEETTPKIKKKRKSAKIIDDLKNSTKKKCEEVVAEEIGNPKKKKSHKTTLEPKIAEVKEINPLVLHKSKTNIGNGEEPNHEGVEQLKPSVLTAELNSKKAKKVKKKKNEKESKSDIIAAVGEDFFEPTEIFDARKLTSPWKTSNIKDIAGYKYY